MTSVIGEARCSKARGISENAGKLLVGRGSIG